MVSFIQSIADLKKTHSRGRIKHFLKRIVVIIAYAGGFFNNL